MTNFNRTYRANKPAISKQDITTAVSELGYRGNLPEEYLVTVTTVKSDRYVEARESEGIQQPKTIIIRSPLQEKFGMKTEANWRPLTAEYVRTSFANEIAQMSFGRTLVNRWTSRRIWEGTSPLDFTLNLRFEAVYDSDQEVISACKELQRLSLPYSGSGLLSEFLLTPPGPNAFDIKVLKDKSLPGIDREGENISVSIGKVLIIPKVIVKDVSVEFLPRFERGGNPIGAVAAIHFQTFEILTQESLDDIYSTTKARIVNTAVTSDTIGAGQMGGGMILDPNPVQTMHA